MSAHDPFDGIYDDAPAQAEVASESEAKSEVTVVAPDDVDVAVVNGSEQGQRLDRGELARMHKANLQAVAQQRGLDSSGSRTDLIERIEAAQNGA